MFQIDGSMKEFVESGVAVLVGTGSADGRPHVAQGWGPRVRDDGTSMDVFLDVSRADLSLANLNSNGRIAVTFAHPVTYRSVQFKGAFRESSEPDEADRSWVQQHRENFLVTTSLVGDPAWVIRNMWLEETVRVAFEVERAFDQTPGPEAGKPL